MNPLFEQPQPQAGGLWAALAQTWPARMAQSALEAAKHPGEVYAGRADPMDIGKALGVAGLGMTGGLGGLGGLKAGESVLGSGPIRSAAWRFKDRLYHGKDHREALDKVSGATGLSKEALEDLWVEEKLTRGFKDATGNFVSETAALPRALEFEQIADPAAAGWLARNPQYQGGLISEWLHPPQQGLVPGFTPLPKQLGAMK